MPARKKTKKEETAAARAAAKKQQEEEEESSEEEESTDDEDRGRGKRQRKSTLGKHYEPEDFTMDISPGVRVIKGRGKKLKDIPVVNDFIEKFSSNSEQLVAAHRFLFSRGRPMQKEMKRNILEFSGYLPWVPKNYDQDKMEKEDHVLEVSNQ